MPSHLQSKHQAVCMPCWPNAGLVLPKVEHVDVVAEQRLCLYRLSSTQTLTVDALHLQKDLQRQEACKHGGWPVDELVGLPAGCTRTGR